MDRGARVGGWGGEQCTMCRPGLFTVERLSLGLVSFSVLLVFFFLWGLFSSVYGERRGTTLPERKASFPKPQTSRVGGGVEEEMLCLRFMFSTRRRVNTRRRKPGMRTRAHGCVSDKGAHARWAAGTHSSPEKKKNSRKEAPASLHELFPKSSQLPLLNAGD